MQERHFINKIHKRLSSDIYKWKINDAYHGGVPDVFYSGPGGHCFVEYKYKKELPKKHNTFIKFGVTAQQCAWLYARIDEGVPVFVALGVGKSIVFNNNFDVVNVYTVRDYITEAMSIDDFIDELEKICIK